MFPNINYSSDWEIIKKFAHIREERLKNAKDRKTVKRGGILTKSEVGMIGEYGPLRYLGSDWESKLRSDSLRSDFGIDLPWANFTFDIKGRELTFDPKDYYPQLFREEWEAIFYDYRRDIKWTRPDGLIFTAVLPESQEAILLGWISLLEFFKNVQFLNKGDRHPCKLFDCREDTATLSKPAGDSLHPISLLKDLREKFEKAF